MSMRRLMSGLFLPADLCRSRFVCCQCFPLRTGYYTRRASMIRRGRTRQSLSLYLQSQPCFPRSDSAHRPLPPFSMLHWYGDVVRGKARKEDLSSWTASSHVVQHDEMTAFKYHFHPAPLAAIFLHKRGRQLLSRTGRMLAVAPA